MSSTPNSAPPAAAENGAHEDEVEALRRQVHELQVNKRPRPFYFHQRGELKLGNSQCAAGAILAHHLVEAAGR